MPQTEKIKTNLLYLQPLNTSAIDTTLHEEDDEEDIVPGTPPSKKVCIRWFRFIVFNTTFNNISVISWLSVLLVEETGVPRENHRPVTRH